MYGNVMKCAGSNLWNHSVISFQMTQFFISDWRSGMNLDALASSHAISLPVVHPRQIKEIFDTITYRKVNNLEFDFSI